MLTPIALDNCSGAEEVKVILSVRKHSEPQMHVPSPLAPDLIHRSVAVPRLNLFINRETDFVNVPVPRIDREETR